MNHIEAIKHYEAALREAFPRGATGDVFEHWNNARKAIAEAEKQEPVAWFESDGKGNIVWHHDSCASDDPSWLDNPMPVYTHPQPKREPLTDDVQVPLRVLEAAEESLGSFCSDQGWSDMDMQNMDNLSAYIAQHKAAHGIKENT